MYNYNNVSELGNIFMGIISLTLAIINLIAKWRIFSKAGEKGWKALIPVYNLVVLFKVSKLSPRLLLTYLTVFIPFVGLIVINVVALFQKCKLSKAFGKRFGFTIGLIFLPTIFYAILGFDSSKYIKTEKSNNP